MSYTEWSIKGPDFGSCNCAWGCPCQFNSPPTNGDCRGMAAMHIEEGFFGDVRLDGLNWVSLYAWPGAVHEGGGEHQSIIDIRASEEQRAAMLAIKSGRHSVPGATVFDVFASVTDITHEPIFAAIEFDVDVEARTARVIVPGLIESIGTPIRNPIIGSEHRAQIAMPDGFEFLVAECGSGTSKSNAAVALDFTDSYGQFAHIHLTPRGPVS
ncbi:MAG: DUF1326 domain-containing protein [Rhodospirillaceae bacterium]|nr:DUF1326 domain-containing protein [Rhodospirillaceae bacterium]